MKIEDLAILFVRGLGSRKLAFLIDSLGSSDAIFATPAKELQNLYGVSESVAEQIASNDQQAKVLAQIAMLERKMANEKQPRRKREYFEQIKKLKSQI